MAALTWQLGRIAPPGVTINALSPIANTRMVKAAFERAQKAGHTGGGGGLTLDSMPGPEDVGPLGAHVVGDGFGWCTGQVLFAGGPEVAVVDQPRLVEAIRTHDTASLAAVLDAVVPRAFVAAEAKQTSDGGANPRFGGIFDAPAPTEPTPAAVQHAPSFATAPTSPPHCGRRRRTLYRLHPRRRGPWLRRHRQVAARRRQHRGACRRRDCRPRRPPAHLDLARRMGARAGRPPGHHQALARRRLLAPGCCRLHGRDRSARATRASGRGNDARRAEPSPGRLADRSGRCRRDQGRLTVFTVGLESEAPAAADAAGELAAHLLSHPDVTPLAGAGLVVREGWIGLRRHPQPIGTVTYGGPDVPAWFDNALREIVAATGMP